MGLVITLLTVSGHKFTQKIAAAPMSTRCKFRAVSLEFKRFNDNDVTTNSRR